MNDPFYERFGELDLGPKDTARPGDGGALYERGSMIRRYTFDELPNGDAWAVDAKTGERAFRADRDGRVFLPNGREIGTPRTLPPRKPKATTAQQIYGKPAQTRRPPPSKTASGMAGRIYGKPKRG